MSRANDEANAADAFFNGLLAAEAGRRMPDPGEIALQKQYRALFFATARERLGRCRTLLIAGAGEAEKLVGELHALAGDADVIGYRELGKLAREAQRAAQSWACGDLAGGDICRRTMAELERELAAHADAPGGQELAESKIKDKG